MSHIITIGNATQDIILEYDQSICKTILEKSDTFSSFACPKGGKINVSKINYCIGGGAINTAISFKRLGFDVTSCFKIGNDDPGKEILEALKREDINTNAFTDKFLKTGTSFIFPTLGDRVIFSHLGANESLCEEELIEELFTESTSVYITSLTNKAASMLPHLSRIAQKQCNHAIFRCIINPGMEQITYGANALKASLANIDMLILNKDEMCLFMTSLMPRFRKAKQNTLYQETPELLASVLAHETISFTFKEYVNEILSYGVKRVVVTNGAEGVYIAHKDGIIFQQAPRIVAKNTVGAGDAFGSCFTAMILQGKTIEQAAQLGVLNAISVITSQDANTGLLSYEKCTLLKKTVSFPPVLYFS